MEIRAGGSDDLGIVLAMVDEAVEWLVAQGRTDQWGSEPFSGSERLIDFMRKLVDAGDLYISAIDGQPVGTLIINEERMHYAPAIDEPELYVRVLVSSRRYKGQRIGSQLLEFARREAIRRGVSIMRVDCYASPDEALVRYYESQGFTRTERLTVGDDGAQVQVFEMRL